MSSAISSSTRFCASGRLERQHRLDLLAHAVGQFERDPRQRARLAALELQAAFQPEELFEDQPELRRRAEGVQQPQIANPAAGSASRGIAVQRSGIFSRWRMCSGSRSSTGASSARMRCINVRSTPRGELGYGLVNRHHAAHMQRGFAIFIVVRREFRTPDASSAARRNSCRTPPCRTARPSRLRANTFAR